MGLLDLLLLALGGLAGAGAFLSGSDALYKLFLGLIIGFLMYLVVANQVEVTTYLSPSEYDSYQSFLATNATGLLSFLLFFVPILGLIFMLNRRLSFQVKSRSIGQILLGFMLPIFLIGMISYLAEGSILSESIMWQNVFSFLSSSEIYNLFRAIPWGIFLLLAFLIFYKSIFLLLIAFIIWIWNELICRYFTSWKKIEKKDTPEEASYEEE